MTAHLHRELQRFRPAKPSLSLFHMAERWGHVEAIGDPGTLPEINQSWTCFVVDLSIHGLTPGLDACPPVTAREIRVSRSHVASCDDFPKKEIRTEKTLVWAAGQYSEKLRHRRNLALTSSRPPSGPDDILMQFKSNMQTRPGAGDSEESPFGPVAWAIRTISVRGLNGRGRDY